MSAGQNAEKQRRALEHLRGMMPIDVNGGREGADARATTVLAQLRERAALIRVADGGSVPCYDGHHPQLGTTVSNGAFHTSPPFTNRSGRRSAAAYTAVINQFAVGENPRYQTNGPGHGETYCNIFVWDVTRAMGAEVPHWVNNAGVPQVPCCGFEQDANGNARWLDKYGPQYGWTNVSADEAQRLANDGKPVVFAWDNPAGRGHVGMVRPGSFHPLLGPAIAQAGKWNVNETHVGLIFDSYATPVYYAHE